MKKRFLCLTVFSMIVLSACNLDEKNELKNISEMETVSKTEKDGKQEETYKEDETSENTQVYETEETDEATQDNEEYNESDYNVKENLRDFISDEHFYDGEEVTFWNALSSDEENIVENFKTKILGTRVFDKLEDASQELESDMEELEWVEQYLLDSGNFEGVKLVEVDVSLTNISQKNQVFHVKHSYSVFRRIKDNRGEKYGVGDKRIEYAMAYTESWTKKGTNTLASDFMVTAGDTKDLKMFFFLPENYLEDELYFGLNLDKITKKETTKLLRIHFEK